MYSDRHLSQKIGSIAEKDYVSLSEDILVGEAAKVMKDKDVLSVIVTSKNSKEPIGIVTERDILYRLVSENKGPFKVTLKDIMSSPLITIAEEESVKDAVLVMRSKHIRRLVVKNAGDSSSCDIITGTITLMSIVGNVPSDKVDLAEVELPSNVIERDTTKIICPYCQSQFKDKAEMSKHIDRIHIGGGLLEGDMRQW